MEAPPPDLFVEACSRAVRANPDYVPPYERRALRAAAPLRRGPALPPAVGRLRPAGADDARRGLLQGWPLSPVAAKVVEGFDRAAPLGVGSANSETTRPTSSPNGGQEGGYPIGLYLDAKERTYVEEFSTSNFVGIRAERRHVTPKSDAILPSITNDSS